MRFIASLLLVTLTAATALADRDYCDRKDGRAQGAIGGAVIGGLLGAALGHGNAGNIGLGAAGGAVAGGLIGHGEDAKHDRRDCGENAAPDVRRDERRDRRDDEQDYSDYRRQRDIEASRGRWDRRRRRMPPPMPRYQIYQCQDTGRGFVLVYLPTGEIVRGYGYDLRSCQSDEFYSNQRR